MAKVVYVNGTTGNNANSGLTPVLAKATILGARAATAIGDRVSIAGGVYLEADVTFNSVNDENVVYMHDGSGLVIIDFANRATAGQHWLTDKLIKFIGLQFRNPGTATVCISSFVATNRSTTIGCTFYQKAGPANTGHGIQRVEAHSCSFHNLNIGVGVSSSVYSSYFLSCTTPFSAAAERDYNAFPGNTETHGINTSVGANPGFRSVATDDFRLSQSVLVDFQAFMAGGRERGRIGAPGGVGPYYNSLYPQTRMFSSDPTTGAFVSWEDDPSYVAAGVLGAVAQDATTGALQLNLSAAPTATDGRARSDVIASPVGKLINFTASAFVRFEDPPAGAKLDVNTTLPAHWEYRYSNTAFLKGDLIPTWNQTQQSDGLNVTAKYIQFRVTLRTDHTNA